MKVPAFLMLAVFFARAEDSLTITTPGYPAGREADYTTSHVFIDEVAGTSVPMSFRFTTDMPGVIDVELWTNLNRRDLADRDKDGDGYPDGVVPPDPLIITDSAADTDPETGHYFAPLDMVETAGGWELTVPVTKTGAYRVTARFRTAANPSTWIWYGRRDHCVVAAPVESRNISLYEVNVFNIEASGDGYASRSTLEDLHDAPGAPHNSANRWNLTYLKNLGCNWLWFQPIHPNGIDGRENFPGTSTPYAPGSPYAVKNFFEVHPMMTALHDAGLPEAANRAAAMRAWQDFAAAADAGNVGIMLDAPFNHTAFDVELGDRGVALFQRDGEPAWSPADEIRHREARFFSRAGNYAERAFDASSIAAGPDRFDFPKWNDVKDVFFGRYDALVEVDAEPERSSHLNEGDWFDYGDSEWNQQDFIRGGEPWNVTRRVWQYFAGYAVHWLEKTRPPGQNRNSRPSDGDAAARYEWDRRGIDGLRCDFGQGLPPRCWEYIINVARSHKWNFVMMAESLDGRLGDGRRPVAYRSNRHFDILNESIVFELRSATTRDEVRGVFEERRLAFGQSVILTNNTSHDEEVMADPWESAIRHLASATVDGAPLVFPGQELGISTVSGYQHYELNLGKQIPHFKRWNSMMPAWNDDDFGNDQLYPVLAAANLARLASPALRSPNRWFLSGNGNHPMIHGVAKYQTPGASPAFSDVVLAFSNLDRDSAPQDQFVIPGELAGLLGIKDGRTYNARNIAAFENPALGVTGRRDGWLWPGGGYSGAQLKSSGFAVALNRVPVTAPAWSTDPFEAQFLKLHDVTPPPSPAPLANYYGIGSSAAFSWIPNGGPDDHIAAWRVELIGGNGEPLAEATVTRTSHVFTGLETGTYRARLTAISAAGISSAAPGESDSGPPDPGSATSALHLLSADGDEDGDGRSNADEQSAGTNPLDPTSVFRIRSISRAAGQVEVTFSSEPGLLYQLESSSSMEPASWEHAGEPLAAAGSATSIAVPEADDRRFYRVKVTGTSP